MISVPAHPDQRSWRSLSFGPNHAIIAGQIVHAYIEERFVLARVRGLVDTRQLKLIGGMHDAKWYVPTVPKFCDLLGPNGFAKVTSSKRRSEHPLGHCAPEVASPMSRPVSGAFQLQGDVSRSESDVRASIL